MNPVPDIHIARYPGNIFAAGDVGYKIGGGRQQQQKKNNKMKLFNFNTSRLSFTYLRVLRSLSTPLRVHRK